MRKTNRFSVVLFLFLLVPASITWAQKITQEKGLTTATFNLSQGTVKIYLPDDIRQGDVISGTVTATPEGRNEKQIQRNLAELSRYTLSLNGQRFNFDPAAASFRFLTSPLSQAQQNIGLYFDKSPNPVQQLTVPAKPISEQKQMPAQCVIPGHVITGSPMNVPGPFDGNANNTQCTIGNQPATILAESPRNCIVQFPPDANGMNASSIKEEGKQACTKNISAVQLDVSAGKLNLVKGENTYIDVKITGLQNLEQTATLNIINLTPETVKLQPSNTIIIPLEPAAVSGGNFNQRFDVQSLRNGPFTCNVNLDFNNIMMSPAPDDKNDPNKNKINNADNNNADNKDEKCQCTAKAAITVMKTENNVISYMAMPLAGCSGPKCGYNPNLKFGWQIVSGNENAEIVAGSQSGHSINIKRKKDGNFSIKNSVTVTCSDGTTCSDTRVFNANGDEIPGASEGEKEKPPLPSEPDPSKGPPVDTTTDGKKVCPRAIKGDKYSPITGGLRLGKFTLDETGYDIPSGSTIHRDDFVPLMAYGMDRDRLIVQCNPVDPPCDLGASQLVVAINGRVKFTWEILNKQGQFVKLGCLYSTGQSTQTTEGDQVIFMPPIVPLPVDRDMKITTEIRLTIGDARGTNNEEGEKAGPTGEEKKLNEELHDDPLVRIFKIITTRTKTTPDRYSIQILYTEAQAKWPPEPTSKPGSCQAKVGGWINAKDIQKPSIKLPSVPDNKQLVMGQLIVLEATNQGEFDVLPGIVCETGGACATPKEISLPFEDNIQWRWSASGNGRFILANHGRYAVYMAPTDFPEGINEMLISITVEAFNPGPGMEPDAEAKSEPITLTVYRAGISLKYPPGDFTPKDNNSVKLVSELKYFKEGVWLPAMEHMCRIHHFEFPKVSAEKGICMNYPEPTKGNECADFFFKTLENQEGYDPQKIDSKCKMEDIFLRGRSRKPEKNFTVEVQSQDFGSYALIRSFVGDKFKLIASTSTYSYDPIVLKDFEVPRKHEERRNKYKDYTDNRVTIPLDIDENQIPDSGYVNANGELIPDPPGGKLDITDTKPTGDEVKGDGLTDYEEYRGFMYRKSSSKKEGESVAAMPEDLHVRSDYRIKTIFIHNQNGLDISLYRTISELEVFEIGKIHYTEDRVVNFNSNPATNVVAQKGLYLRDGGAGGKLLGIARSTTGRPAPPNNQIEIVIYTKSVAEHIQRVRDSVDKFNKSLETRNKLNPGESYKYMDAEAKMRQVIAHELLHGNNVSHHGEGDEKLDVSHDKMNGLRSGNISCVMRYDNTGTKIKSYKFYPEIPGTILCDSPLGTSYNTPEDVEVKEGEKILIKSADRGYGNCAAGRGNCKKQIHITGAVPPPK